MLEASRAHNQLGIDRSRRIDPFAALETSGILVMRQALDRLAGVYLPAEPPGDGRPGVLINVNHPLSKQRYTAAHELCHHRRDHQVVIDLETEWIARGTAPTSDRERIAEAFAAWFLMPKQLIEKTLSDRGLRPDLMSPQDACEFALDLGTSYEATVRHLVDARILAATHRDRLLEVPGRREVRLELRRPWQRGVSPSVERVLEIAAAPKPSAGIFNPRRLVASPASG